MQFQQKTKISASYYTANLLPLLLQNCQHLLQQTLFQQDGVPAHTEQQTQEWFVTETLNFISKDEWPPNSPDLNLLDYCVSGMMLAAYQNNMHKLTNSAELKVVLQIVWDSLS